MNSAMEAFMDEVEAKPPETYYDAYKRVYLVEDAKGDWMPYTETQYKRILRQYGFSNSPENGELLSPQDKVIRYIQHHRNVAYTGPLAGYHKGLHQMGAKSILVTESPNIIKPEPGDWSTILTVLSGMLGDGDALAYLGAWLKIAYESLVTGDFRPGQAVVFCGPHNCGKSLVQMLITQILGGRAARPYQFMTGATGFNSDLFGAEHLVIEDEQPSTDIRTRRAFGNQIKIITVVEEQRMHAKYCDAMMLRPFRRLSISLNDEEENVQVLPPLDNSLEDKMMLFGVAKQDMPMRTDSRAGWIAFRQKLMSELPAFIDAFTRLEIPDALRCPRFGVVHYHDSRILEILDAQSPEYRLLGFIDVVLFGSGETNPAPVILTAAQLSSRLTDRDFSQCCYDARRLLSWSNACGTYLGRLARKRPDRVRKCRAAGERLWEILPLPQT
jgi:hypothetical protein